ncbi:diguanylate cyclase, partial [bacterium]|nr:diguanylate cyclase [bacterium]
LREALARLGNDEGRPAPSGLVNLGDELRLELGDEAMATAEGKVDLRSGMTLLRGMLEELHDPALGGGITLLVLRFAAEFVGRAVIFMVMGEEVVGLGQFGLDDRGGTADERVRSLRVPRREPSLFAGILAARHPAVVRPEPNEWNQYLFDRLGGGVPHEVFLGPIVSGGEVVAILYGDNLAERRPIAGTEALEIFLSQAGIAMEKALLERRLMNSSRSVM